MSYGVLNEIPPLSDKDCFHVVERYKSEFTFPLHQHREYEINFIEHGLGLKRTIGDSIEYTGDYDLILISGDSLEHVWEQGNCKSPVIREITIQFSPDLLPSCLLEKNQFNSIRKMLVKAEHGLAFPLETIMKVYNLIDNIAREVKGFEQFLRLLKLLNELSLSGNSRSLASSSFAHAERNTESRRVCKVKDFINQNYTKKLSLDILSEMVGMTPVAFSRFFKLRTGKTLSEYIIDIRLGYASRMLVDSNKTISEICFDCGFNNLSNFNRIFRKKKNMTPKLFRAHYRKSKSTI
ncbi:MAG: AraC family transcriptional regulator [Bacteroidales bacterium]|jgi:AraC-like DNA-binding protein|nr:AraC family transcriptional regulator [Bacteroidales bacterium]